MTTTRLIQLLSTPETAPESQQPKPLVREALQIGAAMPWWDSRNQARTEERMMAESRRIAKALIRNSIERSTALRIRDEMHQSEKQPS